MEAQADRFFENRQYETALQNYRKIRENETKFNDRQRQTAKIVRCLTALGRTEQSVAEFFVLCRTEPFTGHWTCIPLVWYSANNSASSGISPLDRLALEWLSPSTNPSGRENPVASLLAASVLLSSSNTANQTNAANQLRQLSFSNNDDNPNRKEELAIRKQVAQLAVTQLWRTQIVKLKSEKELANWEPLVETIHEPLKAGPYMVLGDGLAKVQNHEKAIIAWLRVPVLHSENRFLAAKALDSAAQMLKKLGRPDEAKAIFDELTRDYGDQTTTSR